MSGTVDHQGAGVPQPEPQPGPEPYMAPAAARRGRRSLLAGLAVLGVGAGAFGVLALSAGDGSDSPEAAVAAMFDAIEEEDAIGVVEALDPRERDLVRSALDESASQAKRVQLASKELDLRQVEGIDLQVEGVTMSTERLGDGVTAVDLTGGTVRSSADIDRLPVGAVIQEILDRDAAEDDGPPDRTGAGRIELDGVRLVATESDGGWHVSAVYSLAEQVRRDEFPGEPVPTFGQGIGYRGASSPEQAVRDAIEAGRTQDVRRLIELTPPGEADALHDYGPILVRAAGDPPERSSLTVDELELDTADGSDGTKVVTAASFDVRTEDEYRSTSWVYDGRCTTTTYEYDDPGEDGGWFNASPNEGVIVEGQGAGEAPETQTMEVCDDDSTFTDFPFFPALGLTGPAGRLQVVTEQHDGSWYVSPTRSIVASTIGGLKALDGDDVRRLARSWAGDWWVSESDEFWAACGVDQPSLDTSSADGEAAWEQCYDQLPDDYDGPMGFGSGLFGSGWSIDDEYSETTEYDVEETPVDLCFESGDDAAVESCLRNLVATGAAGADMLAGFVCDVQVFGSLDQGGGTDDEYESAEAAFEACMATELEATEPGATTVPAVPTTSAPTASTSVPAGPITPAAPPEPAASTTVPATSAPTG